MLSNSEILQHSTVRLECKLKNSSVGEGTGFYYAFEKEETSFEKLVIVTNIHVIKNSVSLSIYLTPFDTKNKTPQYSNSFKKNKYKKLTG